MSNGKSDIRLKPGERPTLKTIARLSELAVTTVSRALSDAPDISEKTKVKVREIAQQVGYTRNRAGLRLRTGKTNVLALVLSTEHDMMNHHARLITSIAAETRNTPYHLIITPYFPDEDPIIPVRYLVETQSADGIILNQIEPEDARVAYLLEQRFPFVTHGRSKWCDQHPYYDFDNEVFGEYCVNKLVELGRRDILFIAPPMTQNYARNMTDGVSRTAKRRNVLVQRLESTTSDSPVEEIKSEVFKLIKERSSIDGVICASITSSMAAIVAQENAGRTIGKEFDVVAKEAVPFLQSFRAGVQTVQEDVAAAGTGLAKALIQAIDQPEKKLVQVLDVLKP